MDRQELDLAIDTIETLHLIKDDIRNDTQIGYNESIIPHLDYAVNCVKTMIESFLNHDE